MKAGIENEIQAKGLNAPRVTPDDIEAEIVSTHYFTAKQGNLQFERDYIDESGGCLPGWLTHPECLGLLTFCVLVLKNGFTVTGESACASPENFNADIGRKIAREKAKEKIWPLLGFRLRDQLARVQS